MASIGEHIRNLVIPAHTNFVIKEVNPEEEARNREPVHATIRRLPLGTGSMVIYHDGATEPLIRKGMF
jgi:hypothetical protein